jgi:hypothetical protein
MKIGTTLRSFVILPLALLAPSAALADKEKPLGSPTAIRSEFDEPNHYVCAAPGIEIVIVRRGPRATMQIEPKGNGTLPDLLTYVTRKPLRGEVHSAVVETLAIGELFTASVRKENDKESRLSLLLPFVKLRSVSDPDGGFKVVDHEIAHAFLVRSQLDNGPGSSGVLGDSALSPVKCVAWGLGL